MSEVETTPSLVEQMTADLEAVNAPAERTATPDEAPAAAAEEAAPAATPAPISAPEVAKILKTVAAGKEIEVPLYSEDGAINPALVEAVQKAQAWTVKMQAVAEARREVEAMRLALQTQAEVAKLQAAEDALPKLPEDDPYSQHNAANRAAIKQLAEAQAKLQTQLQADATERMEMARVAQLEASQVALNAERKRLSETYKLGDDDLEFVERRYLSLRHQGQATTLDALAQQRRERLDAIKAEAVKEYKEKHLVRSDAGGASAPSTGTGSTVVTPKDPSFAEKFAAELGSILGR